MTMIHLILIDMVDQASGLLAHNHGVLEINVGSMHVPGSKDLLPHPLHDHGPHLLPKAPHRSFVTALLIHPCLLLLCLLHELLRRLRCSRSHGSLHPWLGSRIMVNKIAIAIIVGLVRRRIKRHTRMA